MKIIYNTKTKKVVGNTGTNAIFPEGIPDKYLNLQPDEKTFPIHDKSEEVKQILKSGSYELIFDENGEPIGVKIHPKISISANKNPITTSETCIITATITPAEGDALQDEEVIFIVEGIEYPIMTENGKAQIEYSNENAGMHAIKVKSTTKYGENLILIEVIE